MTCPNNWLKKVNCLNNIDKKNNKNKNNNNIDKENNKCNCIWKGGNVIELFSEDSLEKGNDSQVKDLITLVMVISLIWLVTDLIIGSLLPVSDCATSHFMLCHGILYKYIFMAYLSFYSSDVHCNHFRFYCVQTPT